MWCSARGRSYPLELPAFGSAQTTWVEVRISPVIKVSLRVRDPAAAKMRAGAVISQLERIFESLR